MKLLGVLMLCLGAVTANLSGYSYNIGGSASLSPSIASSGSSNLGPSLGSVPVIGLPAPPQHIPSVAHHHVSHQVPQIQHHVQQHVAQPVQQQQVLAPVEELNKEYYTFSAPEEEFSLPQNQQQVSSVNRRNLQVVFIHTPEHQGLNRAVEHLAQQSLEQQTAIYVLTKQADLSQLTNTLRREQSQVQHPPEVHFIKYRTPEDAARAQQSIRAQYDALGGSSSHGGESVAPVINFASQAPVSHSSSAPVSHGSHSSHVSHGSIGHGSAAGHSSHSSHVAPVAPVAPSQTYLPLRFK